ncbi:hypothetical protein [Dehalococcoides mccartyi]|uniref:hypothetical protein n=1 Tax=Dehalococcoides mccartyi TaxID=61435 RepID=UPI000870E137|nr:hypothetical protein [Dehalococcoides mccartyi]AOV98875.1 hypothetical protein DCWBC2_0202 [Dehalococcoides mccartyi]
MVTAINPPRVLSMEEYQTQWKQQGWQLIVIGPTATWRQEWDEWAAIRDIVQNALDEAESYSFGYDDQGLWISDHGRGIAVANFLLGPPKLKPDYARGKFGEGMKIAALALIRKGYSVHIETGNKEIWIIFLEQEAEGKVQTLAALWRPVSTPRTGTRFHIIGYFGEAFADRFAVNLSRKQIVAEAPSQITQPIRRFNQLIRTPEGQKSRIFVRDIYLQDIESQFSYNLWSFELSPDRFGPKKESDLWTDMGRLWSCITRQDLLETFMKMVSQPAQITCLESENLSLSSWSLGTEPVTGKSYTEFIKENASSWRDAWQQVMGENKIIRTDDRWNGTVKHLGYESTSVSWHVRDTLGEVILTDANLVKASQERLREAEVIPDNQLSHRQLAHLKLARAITKDVLPYGPVSGVLAAIIPAASDRVRTAGMYSRITQEIFIGADMLEHAQTTIDTVIHEIAHHTSGSDDLEERHAAAMTEVAAKVVKETAGGAFDDLLMEVTW